MYFIALVLENLVLSSDDNEDLIYCLKVKCPSVFSGVSVVTWLLMMYNFHNCLILLSFHLQGWNQSLSMSKSKSGQWALYAKSVLDRTRLALASKAEWYQQVLQPSAEYLGSLLGVDQWAVCL